MHSRENLIALALQVCGIWSKQGFVDKKSHDAMSRLERDLLTHYACKATVVERGPGKFELVVTSLHDGNSATVE